MSLNSVFEDTDKMWFLLVTIISALKTGHKGRLQPNHIPKIIVLNHHALSQKKILKNFLKCCKTFWSTCWRRRDRGWQIEILHPEVPEIGPMATALSRRLTDMQGWHQTGPLVILMSSKALSSLLVCWTKMTAWRPKFVSFSWCPQRICILLPYCGLLTISVNWYCVLCWKIIFIRSMFI